MNKILTVGFDFHDCFHYSIIQVKESTGKTAYRITIMNGTLEQMLTAITSSKKEMII